MNHNVKKKNIKRAERYPKSTNGLQCIGPCYYSNTKILHPLTLEEITNVSHNFCPVDTYVYTTNEGKNIVEQIDRCFIPTAKETIVDDFIIDNILTPQFNFSSLYFVKIYYRINNIDELLTWLQENRNDPYKTKERVFNNSMVAYGKDLNIIDHRLVNFINDLMMYHLAKIYRYIKKYFIIENEMIKIINPDKLITDNKNISNESIKNIRIYIKDKLLGTDNIHQFMSKFIRYYKEDLSNRQISTMLVDNFIDYIKKKLKLSFDYDQE